MIYFLILFNKRALPVLIKYAESDVIKITTEYINSAIKEKLEHVEINEIMQIVKNNNDEIVAVDFNTENINKSLYTISSYIQNNLKNINNTSELIKKDKNIYYIPYGVIFGSPIISNIGPRIPIKTYLTGNVVGSVDTEIKDYGINNALLKVSINIETKINVVMPFISKENKIKINIPIAMKVIQGKVPQVYGGLYSSSSSLFELDS